MSACWRVLDTGAGSAGLNMAVDVLLAEGSSSPVLRWYGWDPAAVSIGYGQRPDDELDLDRCAAAGVQVVRRPTGGRAVLHSHELTYSLSCRQDDALLGGTVEQTSRLIGECFVEGLRQYGVEATLERAHVSAARARQGSATLPCFASAARSEVTCRGRKLLGSAQRRTGGTILQHGSLPLDGAHRQLVHLMADMPSARRRAWERQLADNSTDLSACAPGSVDRARLVQCLTDGFAARLGVELLSATLTSDELARAQRLAQERFPDLAHRSSAAHPTGAACPLAFAGA